MRKQSALLTCTYIVLLWFLFDILLCLTSCSEKKYTHEEYMILIRAEQIYNDSVGSEWSKEFKLEGDLIQSGDTIQIPIGSKTTKTLDIIITEKDDWPDVGSGSISILIEDGYETSAEITVIEDQGRFKGNKAKWKITCTVRHVRNIACETS